MIKLIGTVDNYGGLLAKQLPQEVPLSQGVVILARLYRSAIFQDSTYISPVITYNASSKSQLALNLYRNRNYFHSFYFFAEDGSGLGTGINVPFPFGTFSDICIYAYYANDRGYVKIWANGTKYEDTSVSFSGKTPRGAYRLLAGDTFQVLPLAFDYHIGLFSDSELVALQNAFFSNYSDVEYTNINAFFTPSQFSGLLNNRISGRPIEDLVYLLQSLPELTFRDAVNQILYPDVEPDESIPSVFRDAVDMFFTPELTVPFQWKNLTYYGVFVREGELLDMGDFVIRTENPEIWAKTTDLQGVKQGDPIVVGGESYVIQDIEENYGILRIQLRRAQ